MPQPVFKASPVLIAAFMICGVLANVSFWKMLQETNARLALDQKFSLWWWTMGKHVRLWKAHKQLRPESRWRACWAASFAGAIAVMILIVIGAVLQMPR